MVTCYPNKYLHFSFFIIIKIILFYIPLPSPFCTPPLPSLSPSHTPFTPQRVDEASYGGLTKFMTSFGVHMTPPI